MKSKMTTNSQLSTTEPKTNTKRKTKETGIGTESQKWRSHGGLSERRGPGKGKNEGKGTGHRKHKW